ncbi:MAG: hypothetical protein EBU92_15435, partial [Betaproteobacteria bacterium]|nr:hypothetical protein [Betaproteobacteria bacterium]
GNQESISRQNNVYFIDWQYGICFLEETKDISCGNTENNEKLFWIDPKYIPYYFASLAVAPKRENVTGLEVYNSVIRWPIIKDHLQFCTELRTFVLNDCNCEVAHKALVLLTTRPWNKLLIVKIGFPHGVTATELVVLKNHVDRLEWEIVTGESLNNVGVKSCILLQLMRPSWWHGARAGSGGGVGEGTQY